jgi:hypothetical protein
LQALSRRKNSLNGCIDKLGKILKQHVGQANSLMAVCKFVSRSARRQRVLKSYELPIPWMALRVPVTTME